MIVRRMDLSFPRTDKISLKEQLLRFTLHNVRTQGHPYVDLREEGKNSIFYCIICHAPCYNYSCLYDHLKGNLHTRRLASVKATMFKPNPWPFSDGEFFFHSDSEEISKSIPASDCEQNKVLTIHHARTDSLAVVKYKASVGPVSSRLSEVTADPDENPCISSPDDVGTGWLLVIPAVLQEDDISDLKVRKLGVGKICARFSEKNGIFSGIHRIWCEWRGNADITNEDVNEHEFAIVTFSYNYNLGRRRLVDDCRNLPLSSPHPEPKYSSSYRGKQRKLFSDPEHSSEVLANQYDSSREELQSSSNSKSNVVFFGNDDQLISSCIRLTKTKRKILKLQESVASDRTCGLCKQKFLLNKDVAALLNKGTGKLACSSRNITGAFHVFHISCLIQWILLCEVEVFAKQPVEPKGKQKSQMKVNGKNRQNHEIRDNQIRSTYYCPECQGTGIKIDGDDLEKADFSLSEIKLCDARKAWIESPERLENCSLGFNFPLQSDEVYQQNVAPLKLLHFYRAKNKIISDSSTDRVETRS